MKKKITVISLIILIIVIIIFIKTDLFKTKEILFWKYMLVEKEEITQVVSNDVIKQYNNNLENSSYIKEGSISVESKNNLINPINIQLYEKGNNKQQCVNTSITLKYDEKDLGNLLIVKDNNYFLLKSNLIGSNYIGFENENLKEIAKKFGLANTDYIPNKIGEINYYELFSIEENEKNHILRKYIPIFRKIVNNKNYSKEENVKLENGIEGVTCYKVEISEKELNEIVVQILNEVVQDDITLEFICRKIELLDDESIYCNKDILSGKIKELIKDFQLKEAEDEMLLSIIIYEKEKNVIKTELMLKNERTISIENIDSNKIIIKQYDVSNQKIEFNNIEGIITTILNMVSEIIYTRNIINNETNEVDINIICNMGIEKITININYVEQIKNNVENLIYKKDVEYIDLRNFSEEIYINILEKLFKIERFGAGKNY